jgi:hypothetical protein
MFIIWEYKNHNDIKKKKLQKIQGYLWLWQQHNVYTSYLVFNGYILHEIWSQNLLNFLCNLTTLQVRSIFRWSPMINAGIRIVHFGHILYLILQINALRLKKKHQSEK